LTELASLQGVETGRITIGAMPLSRARLLPAAVSAFYRTYPDVRINIVEGSFQELIEPLRDGELDLIIGAATELEHAVSGVPIRAEVSLTLKRAMDASAPIGPLPQPTKGKGKRKVK
jgi:DNA-binding transcriptional LysR family regulator